MWRTWRCLSCGRTITGDVEMVHCLCGTSMQAERAWELPKRRKKRRPAGDGTFYSFHGAFTDKSKAEAKAKKRSGFVISRVPRGQHKRRYIVLGEKVPF